MTVTFKASLAVVGFIFIIYFQASVCEPPTNILVEIGSDLLCRISKWETIRLKWFRTLHSRTKNPVSLPKVRSFWRQQDNALKKATEKQLYQSGKHPPNCTTACTCNGNVSAYISTRNNSVIWNKTLSFMLEMSSVGAQILGVRYLAVEDLENVLEVYLRPADSTGDVSYNLAFCWLDDYGLAFFDQLTCPTYTTVRFECSERARDVYRVPNSKGFVCAAAVKNVINYSAYKLRVVTSGKGFTSTSEEWNVKTYQSSLRPLENEPGNLHLVLISPKPRYFITTPTLPRGIKINCENNGAKTYNLSYKCTNGARSSNLVKTVNSFVVRDPKFRPTTECRLCVQTLKFSGGLQSEPVCNTTTLFLESPSAAPTITCDSNTCPTTSDGETRNLTVTCEFPPMSSWNGSLTKLVARYRNQTSQPEDNEVVQFNVSSCCVLLRGLRTKRSYYVTVEVCNDKGCSDISNEVEISPLNHNKSGNSFTVWWLIILLLVLLVVTAGFIAGVRYRRNPRAQYL